MQPVYDCEGQVLDPTLVEQGYALVGADGEVLDVGPIDGIRGRRVVADHYEQDECLEDATYGQGAPCADG